MSTKLFRGKLFGGTKVPEKVRSKKLFKKKFEQKLNWFLKSFPVS
jgi:hypothetical protein